jgi:hypothetical protein
MADRLIGVFRTPSQAVDTTFAGARALLEYRTPSEAVDTALANVRYAGFLLYDPEYGGLGTITGRVVDDSSAGPYTVRLYTYATSIIVREILTDSAGFFTLAGLRTEFEWLVVGYSNNPSDAYDPAADRIYLTGSATANLTIGLSGLPGDQVYTADLILTSPYVEPEGNLLVLRSRPDIEPVTGTLAVVETPDAPAFEGLRGLAPRAISGTLTALGGADTAAFAGAVAYPAITGEFSVTETADPAAFSGPNLGLTVRGVTIAAVESPDVAAFEATYEPNIVGTLDAVGANDGAAFQGAFYAYAGPGYLIVDGRLDLAAFAGTNIYDVTGAFAVTEAADAGVFAATTYQHFDAPLLENVAIGSDSLSIGEINVSLVSRGIGSDKLDASPDMTFVETAVASDELSGYLRISDGLIESAVATDQVSAIIFADATETAIASDALAAVYEWTLQDTAIGRDTLASMVAITGALSETALAGDTLATMLFGDATENAVASDILAGDIQGWGDLSDRALGGDALTSSLVVNERVLEDVAVASDAVSSLWLVDAEEVGIATDALGASPISATAELVEVAVASDALAGGLTVYADLLTDRALGGDALTSNLTLIGVLSDTALGGDSLVESAQTVHVMNAETGAMSTYVFTPTLTGAAEFRGVLYLAGPEGLYALDAEQDDDGSVVWKTQTGFSDLGTDLLKRIQDVNVQARTAGNTVLEVTSDRYGAKKRHDYLVPPLTRDSYRDGIVKPGRGIQSVYYSLGLRGTGPAEIDQLRLVVTPLSRRR